LVNPDLASGTVTARVATGDAPRSIAISDPGTALYVVNYNSNSVSKVRTSDMVELAELKNRENPIGITYDADTREVWIANYSGSIQIFTDVAP
jgi:DNA-binding beta-propeller fold protein YncE